MRSMQTKQEGDQGEGPQKGSMREVGPAQPRHAAESLEGSLFEAAQRTLPRGEGFERELREWARGLAVISTNVSTTPRERGETLPPEASLRCADSIVAEGFVIANVTPKRFIFKPREIEVVLSTPQITAWASDPGRPSTGEYFEIAVLNVNHKPDEELRKITRTGTRYGPEISDMASSVFEGGIPRHIQNQAGLCPAVALADFKGSILGGFIGASRGGVNAIPPEFSADSRRSSARLSQFTLAELKLLNTLLLTSGFTPYRMHGHSRPARSPDSVEVPEEVSEGKNALATTDGTFIFGFESRSWSLPDLSVKLDPATNTVAVANGIGEKRTEFRNAASLPTLAEVIAFINGIQNGFHVGVKRSQ